MFPITSGELTAAWMQVGGLPRWEKPGNGLGGRKIVTVWAPGQDKLNKVKILVSAPNSGCPQITLARNRVNQERITLFLKFFFVLFPKPVPLTIMRQYTSLEKKLAAFALTQACHMIFHHAAALQKEQHCFGSRE